MCIRDRYISMTDIFDRLMHSLAVIKDRIADLPVTLFTDERRDDDDDIAAMVTAKLRPRPYRGAGAIALREPE